MRPAVKAALTDADKAVDFTRVIQGHVGKATKQLFTSLEESRQSREDVKVSAVENLIRDQFGNMYMVHRAHLFDGELYAVTHWIGIEKWTGTKKGFVPVKQWKKFKVLDEALKASVRLEAFIAFGRANVAILKGRHAAKLPAIPSNIGGN